MISLNEVAKKDISIIYICGSVNMYKRVITVKLE